MQIGLFKLPEMKDKVNIISKKLRCDNISFD